MSAVNDIKWGRLVLAGGTDFASLGRKDKLGRNIVNPENPDLVTPHIWRPVANIKFKQIHTSHSGCHGVAITVNGDAFIFGRNDHAQLTSPLPPDITYHHPSEDVRSESVINPVRLTDLPDSNVPRALKQQKIATAACGRSHTLLVTENGEVWATGFNTFGQCALPEESNVDNEIKTFTRVAFKNEKIIAAAAGLHFSIFLSETGRVYSAGSAEHGQTGIGRTGEHIRASKVFFDNEFAPVLLRGDIEGVKIVSISCGQNHCTALDDTGACYSWGFGGLGRLGHNSQTDFTVPTRIELLATNAYNTIRKISCGSTHTMYIDAQGNLLISGKWKNTGDGSPGQPWMVPKVLQDMSGFEWRIAAGGSVSLFGFAVDESAQLTVAWGQGCQHAELGLGDDKPKSSTKPTKLDSMVGLDVIDIAAGQNSTFFLVRPPASIPPEERFKPKQREEDSKESTPGGFAFDLSGFGFSFAMPTPESEPEVKKKEAPPPVKEEEEPEEEIDEALATWNALPRFPVPYDVPDECQICNSLDENEDNVLMECDKCAHAYHKDCLHLASVPEGEWFCPDCDGSGDDGKRKWTATDLSIAMQNGQKKRKI